MADSRADRTEHPSVQVPAYYGAGVESRVRYDNERGKGDHRHLGEREESYFFTSIEQLLDDFERDVANWSEE